MQPEAVVDVEASRLARQEKQKSRYRDRGGVFVPAETNPLLDILLARADKSGKSPRKVRRISNSPVRRPPPDEVEDASGLGEDLDPQPEDIRPKRPTRGKTKSASKTSTKKTGRKPKAKRDEGEPEAGPSRPSKAAASKKPNTKAKSKPSAKAAAQLLKDTPDDEHPTPTPQSTVPRERKTRDTAAKESQVPELSEKASRSNAKRRRVPEGPLEDVVHDASPVPTKRAKISQEKAKLQEVATSSGGGEDIIEPEEHAGSKVGGIKQKKRNGKRGGDDADNVQAEGASGTPATRPPESQPPKPTPILNITPHNDTTHKQGPQPENEDDTPLASKLTLQPQKLKKQVRKRITQHDDDGASDTHSRPQHDTVPPKQKRSRKQKISDRNTGLDEHGGKDDRPPPKEQPLRLSTPVRPISPLPNPRPPAKQDTGLPPKKKSKGKAKEKLEQIAVAGGEDEEEIASRPKSSSRLLKENKESSRARGASGGGHRVTVKKLHPRKPKPRLSLFPAPEIMYVSDDDPIDFLS